MQFYGQDKYPVSNDNSFDLKHLISFFSPKYKAFMHKDVCNKYLFSFGTDWLCIQRYHSKFRVIGRFVSDFDVESFCPNRQIKTDFDIFFVGDFDSCVCTFVDLVCHVLVLPL